LLDVWWKTPGKCIYKDLNEFYLREPAFWEIDDTWEGFSWIANDDFTQNIIVFRRIAKGGKEIIVVVNFAPVTRENYRIGVPRAGVYEEVFNSDLQKYGGLGNVNSFQIKSEHIPMHSHPQSITITVQPMAAVYFKFKKSIK
jgi:1,4-alpha-glucan branching enzyme